MEGLEIHPLTTRTVCLNQPQLKPWWITQGLSTTLGCFYNPHQPQVIWTEVSIQTPASRILKIKGHTSHALPSANTPVLTPCVQMGTYLTFYIPKSNNSSWSSCHLVLNGVQSVFRENENPPRFSIHLISNEDNQYRSKTEISSNNNNEIEDNLVHRNNGFSSHRGPTPQRKDVESTSNFVARRTQISREESLGSSIEEFSSVEEMTSIAEEEDDAPSDQDSDDASEDIHKIVLRRLIIRIDAFVREWEKSKKDQRILTLLLKPDQKHQAWQFLSTWVTVKEKHDEVCLTSTLTRRKGVTRQKPHPSPTPINK